MSAAWGQKMRADTLTISVTGELQLKIELTASENYIRANRSDIDETVACWEEALNKLGWYYSQETCFWATPCGITADGENIYRTSFSLKKGVKTKNKKNIKFFITQQEYEEYQKTKSRGFPWDFFIFAKYYPYHYNIVMF